MKPLPRVLLRLLPAVVVVGVVGVLVVRPLLRPDFRVETAAIEAKLCAPSEREAALRDLLAFVERHADDDEARWYAVDALARAHAVRSALAVWSEPAGSTTAPGSARRLALAMVRGLAYAPCGGETDITVSFPRCIQARLDVADDGAEAALSAITRPLRPEGVLSLYAPMHRSPSRSLDALGRALFARTDAPELAAAGATLLATPGNTAVAAALRDRIASPWRRERPFFFQHMVRALGTIGGDEAVAFLRERRAAEEREGEDREARRRMTFDVGLVLAGDAAAGERLLGAVAAEPATAWAIKQWALGLGVALAHGRPEAAATLRSLWERVPDPEVRLQIGISTLLADPAPDAAALPLDAWADELARGATAVARTVGHAWALRQRKAGALDAIVADVLAASREADVTAPESFDDDAPSAFFEALRALVRWG